MWFINRLLSCEQKPEHKKESIYQKKYTFNERYNQSQELLEKYPDKIPAIIEGLCDNLYILPKDMIFAKLIFKLNLENNISSNEKVIVSVNNDQIPSIYSNIHDIYKKYVNDDGILYIYFIHY
jgi:hypothetical protein